MAAYEDCISATSTSDSPWYIIPANDKKNTRLIVSHIILELFTDLKMNYSKSDPEREKELTEIRKHLID
jgi:polyphosphate kinase 2 (PPK2 family)